MSASATRVLALLLVSAAMAPGQGVKARSYVTDSRELERIKDLGPTPDAPSRAKKEVKTQAIEALKAKQYGALDKMAENFRTGDLTFGDGDWKSPWFYRSFSHLESSDTDQQWHDLDLRLEDWVLSKPVSAAPRIAYARFLVDYAWRARGTGSASSITPANQRLMRDRLSHAKRLLDEARALPEKDPGWYTTALRVALGQNESATYFDTLVEDSHRDFPKMWETDASRAFTLLPRWYGNAGDWEKFAAATSARPDGPGQEAYARIVYTLLPFYRDIFDQTNASWEDTKAGLKLMRERYPDSIVVVSQAALLASEAKDKPFAMEMFRLLDNRMVPTVFRSKEEFAHYSRWALPSEITINMALQDTSEKERNLFNRDVYQYQLARDLEAMEKLAAELRASDESFPNGERKLHAFYEGLVPRAPTPEEMWTLERDRHEEWLKKRPDSPTARMVYARFLLDYAWRARKAGGKDAATSYRQRLAKAKKLLEEARELKEKDPYWYPFMVAASAGSGASEEELDQLVAAGRAAYPKVWETDAERAFSLLPANGGKPGAWEAFAEEASARPKGPGPETYARIVIRLAPEYDNIFEQSKASWDRTRSGLDNMQLTYPGTSRYTSYAALFASLAKDKPYAREMFGKQIGRAHV